jgi:mRNA interferase MazF
VVARNDVYWADLGPPAGRRPVVVLTRDAACEVLEAVTCAPITRTIRGIRSEVPVGAPQGLPVASVINCDNVLTVPKVDLDPEPVGRLDEVTRAALDRAMRFALDIGY